MAQRGSLGPLGARCNSFFFASKMAGLPLRGYYGFLCALCVRTSVSPRVNASAPQRGVAIPGVCVRVGNWGEQWLQNICAPRARTPGTASGTEHCVCTTEWPLRASTPHLIFAISLLFCILTSSPHTQVRDGGFSFGNFYIVGACEEDY